ncbi:MAG: 4-hydroxy-tetrahydrodipicolinate reductase [Candidatus Cloacimonetes bacterium]|nr:4-hydroxy-tetrahydrodipicolinate reductase [Candidatus Cloacimonadota bacterium]
MLKAALIGYGKLGKLIRDLAPRYNVQIHCIIDPNLKDHYHDISAEALEGCDVCIEFSHPSAVLENIRKVAEQGKNLVVGTTGWNDKLPQVQEIVDKRGIGLLYGANFSIGMNLFLRLIANAVREFDAYPEYDIAGYEMHHNQKADSPSGTAISICKEVLANSSRKTHAVYDKLDRKIAPEELHFASLRLGQIPGTHALCFDSEADTIELSHRVRNRSCFAVGALHAARWIRDKKGLFNITDMVEEMYQARH